MIEYRELKRKHAVSQLHSRAHAAEFPPDGHVMFCVSLDNRAGLPRLRLQRWEPLSWHGSCAGQRVKRLEGEYSVSTLQTVSGEHPDDVRTLAEARPEMEAEARRLEAEAYLALQQHRDEVRATLEQARLDYQAAEQSVRALNGTGQKALA